MQIRNEKNELERRGQDVAANAEAADKELQEMGQKIQRSSASKESKLNNVKAVAG